ASLTACKSKPAEEPEASSLTELAEAAEAEAQAEAQEAQNEAPASEPVQSEPAAEGVTTPEELVGTWVLSGDNDMEALEAVYPGAGEIGGLMEIGMDGLMFWYIGNFGGAGTFTVDSETLNAEIYPDASGSPEPAVFTVDGDGNLIMDYRDATVIWVLQ
ncbi:MAG: hypothetical protein IKT99_07480, partial [Oscillospiraceae bacterium]|nr:hypothetical protein [Oscillospiraceae bacterium]